MVRGRDWHDEWSSARDVGRKVVAQNLADVAAMGAVPTALLVALMADPDTEVAWCVELADGIAAAHGVRAEVDWEVFYPVTLNDAAEVEFTAATLTELFGEQRVVQAQDPIMGSEDFSFVAREVPGCFFFLQCSPPQVDPETAAYNHSPLVLHDDAVLADQATALATLAFERLQRG